MNRREFLKHTGNAGLSGTFCGLFNGGVGFALAGKSNFIEAVSDFYEITPENAKKLYEVMAFQFGLASAQAAAVSSGLRSVAYQAVPDLDRKHASERLLIGAGVIGSSTLSVLPFSSIDALSEQELIKTYGMTPENAQRCQDIFASQLRNLAIWSGGFTYGLQELLLPISRKLQKINRKTEPQDPPPDHDKV